ncbi:tRNA guanosine(15) transglycosylase TgtA [Cuniculiplasma sp. SKW3]|uniref:tRNA guanosine(15) transglycosylase TgtA n=1 Tax=Cuniculiplasma sp. SKW3 TaxID=3400170 RepID=UPI003FD380A5
MLTEEKITMELLHREGLARIGRFKTPHGYVDTPNIMPVINPNIRTLPIETMKRMGMQCIITNSYIIRRNAELRERALKDGLHSLVGFDGPIMTDSGTFQSYVYGDVEFQNADTVKFQIDIGSDISTILDIFSTPDNTLEEASYAVEETKRRMEEVEAFSYEYNVAGPIQGSVYPDLRAKSARMMSQTSASYLPIGGVVPLLEQYRYSDLVDIIITSKLNSTFSKPVHLFGGGHPMFMGMAVLLGVDMFDSASYVKYARDDRMLFPEGTRDLKELMEIPIWSPLYSRYNASELKSLDDEERKRVLAEHNLFTIYMELGEIRERIREQTLWQYVEGKARSHPALMQAFRRILDYSEMMNPYTELYRKSPFFYFDDLSARTPYGYRIRNMSKSRDNCVEIPKKYCLPAGLDQSFIRDIYEKSTDNFSFPFGDLMVPAEMEESYPIQQSIIINRLPESYRGTKIEIQDDVKQKRYFPLEKIRFLADLQFGTGSGKALFVDDIKIDISKKTGRIRTIRRGEKIIATMRAHDGYLALTMDGGEVIRQFHRGIKNRVRVTEESAKFNSVGKSVFYQFILECDEEIVPYNDVLVVDPEDHLVAVGRALASGKEMGQYKKGIAVTINHHRKDTS